MSFSEQPCAWLALLALGAGIIASPAQVQHSPADPMQNSPAAAVLPARGAQGGSGSGGPGKAVQDYAIGPGDVVAVQVWKEPDLSRTMPVRPDGKISLPVIGQLQASGLTAAELQQGIAAQLQAYVRNPQVNVTVEEIRSRTFNVLGKVVKAGSFELIKPTTVLDAIALAGGFQDFARVTRIYILRSGENGATAMLPFNYKQVIKGRHAEQNVLLRPADTVVVP